MILEFKSIDLYGHKLFSWATVKTPARITGAMADQEACFTYVLQGESQVYSEKEVVYALPHDVLLSKCGNYITNLFSSCDVGIHSTITVHFHEAVLKKVYQHDVQQFLNEPLATDYPNMAKLVASTFVRQYIEGIRYYFRHPQLVTDALLVLKLKEILLLLLQTDNAPQVRALMQHLFTKRTFSFREVVEAHICSTISLSELAALTNHSLSSFKREFKRVYADTPANYIICKRVEKVAELLLLSDESISHIAWECGFKSLAHLSKLFKARYGISPSAYRLSQAGVCV